MSDLTLIIGNKNYSSWSLRPWIFMKTEDIEFAEKRVPLDTDQTEKLLKPLFSDNKVPVLVHKKMVIWDSLAILEYLADTFPESHGWPSDPKARSAARSASAEIHSSFFDLRQDMPMNCRKTFSNFTPLPGAQRDIDRIIMVWKFCKKRATKQGPWLFGDFCIADAMFAPVCFRFHTYGVSLQGFEKEYVQSMLAHPPMIEWNQAAEKEKEVLEYAEVKQ